MSGPWAGLRWGSGASSSGPGDYVIGGVLAQLGTTLLAITENGYGKRTHIEEYIRSGGEPSTGEASA